MFAARYFPKSGETPVISLPYIGDTTIYDLSGPTGSVGGGTVLTPEYTYD